MKSRISFLIALLAVGATTALAHTGVKDPQVMARMNLMMLVSEDMKVLGGIAKGQATFDLNVISEKSERLADHARKIETLFKAQASDLKSEAKDTIWSDWDGFLARAQDMETAAGAISDAADEYAFLTAFRKLGKTCSACHEGYRINTN